MSKDLKEYRNDILAGKKIFSIFEKMEEAVNALVDKETTAVELVTVIEQRQKTLAELDGSIAAGNQDVAKAKAEAKSIRTQADKDAAKKRADAERDCDEAVKAALKTVEDANNQLKEIQELKVAEKEDLAAVTADIDTARKTLATIQGEITKAREGFLKSTEPPAAE